MRRGITLLTISLGLLAAACSTADAHFLWVQLATSKSGQLTTEAYFSEGPTAGNVELVDKIAKATYRLRTDADQTQPLALHKQTSGDAGSLTATVDKSAVSGGGSCVAEADYNYGVYTLRGQPTLLNYYAKSIHAAAPADLARLARSKSLALDVVPELADGNLNVTVLWQGQPLANAAVTVIGPNDKSKPQQTDAQGHAALGRAADISGIRAVYVEPKKAGQRDGQAYSQVHHYATLTLSLPRSDAAPTVAVAATPAAAHADAAPAESAKALLAKARAARAVWTEFPGFTADLAVQTDNETATGKLVVSGDGKVDVQIEKWQDMPWLKQQLRSIVQHRMPDGSLGDGAEYVDQLTHPLGRNIRLTEAAMSSDYRIREDVVAQVTRTMGSKRFVISVINVMRNSEGKYLPTVFTVSNWDQKSGSLLTSETVTHAWTRVGKFDLPVRIADIETGSGVYRARNVELSNHRLNPASATAKRQ
ncbi:MAG: DUF3386 family protein [Planctomycetia bacterium]|nr:DUF3386 family protein [Planctomycetia bacterium]